jgi:hypothetical protein
MLDTVTSGAFTIFITLSAVGACASSTARRIAAMVTWEARKITYRPLAAMCVVALSSLVFNLAWARCVGWPFPHVHDEFSYLLAGDTFLHGRLTNPPHPMWKHFETLQVIQQPTYASKYPPAQGLAIALGSAATGQPIAGIWITTALACAALYWMLLAWVSRGWALLGAMLAVFHPELLFWSQSYWGGSIALGAGAMVIGALPRILKAMRMREVIVLGIGIAVLANTRPFEGLMLVIPVLGTLAVWGLFRKDRAQRMEFVYRIALPLGIMGVITAGWMGFYNWRVTGSPAKLPYVLHEEQYASAPLFVFESPRPQPKVPFQEIMAAHVDWDLHDYQVAREAPLDNLRQKFSMQLNRYQHRTALLFPLIALPWVIWRDRRLAASILLMLSTALAVGMETFTKSHYIAGVAGLMLILIVGCMRHLYCWQRQRRAGQLLVWSVVLMTAFGYGCRYIEVAWPESVLPGEPLGAQRERIEAKLNDLAGKHLVLVSYDVPQGIVPEWVYNAANVDDAKVVWAHDMGPAENQDLINYYRYRRVWHVLVSPKPAEAIPYVADATTRSMTLAGGAP